MEHFTPVSASMGGVLIGLSATMLWLANVGRLGAHFARYGLPQPRWDPAKSA
jgi:hypothetical protein